MNRIIKFDNFVNEALGVPTNIIPLAKELFDFIVNGIYHDDDLEGLCEGPLVMSGSFNIADMPIKDIVIGFGFGVSRDKRPVELAGMGSHFDRFLGINKKTKGYYSGTFVKDEVLMSIKFLVPENVTGRDIINYMKKEKEFLIPILAHELKHFYDKFKNPRIAVKKWTDYTVVAGNSFGPIEPLNEFLFLSYYTNEFENLVRPTEMAAMIDVKRVTPDKFKSFFLDSDIYKKLNSAKEFSLSKLKEELKNYFAQIVVVLLELGYDAMRILNLKKEDLIELILKEFYESLLTWKGQMMETLLYPRGKHPLRFIGNKDRFYDEYLNKITKFASDYNSFYKSEEKFLNQESFRMIKKLARLYELTDIYRK